MSTPNKNLNLPANGSSNWDQPLNTNFTQLDTALAGTQSINVTGVVSSPIVLSGTTTPSYIPIRIAVTGTLTLNMALQLPAGITGLWDVANYSTGAFTLSFTSAGGGSSVTIPQGAEQLVYCNGTNVTPVGASPNAAFRAGDLKTAAYSTAPAGWLICYGQAVSRTTYAALFAAIGTVYGAGDGSTTFNVPDYRGRVLAAADNMGGVAAGRLTGYVLGTAGGEQTHTLVTAEIPYHNHSVTDPGHAHVDGGHVHSFTGVSGTGNVAAGFNYGLGATSTAVGHASIQSANTGISIGYAGSSGAHNNIQPTLAAYVFIYTGQ